jgi:hypothetical protein
MGENENNNGNGGSSWSVYQRLVLSEISRLDRDIHAVFKNIGDLDSDIHKELNNSISEVKKLIADIDKSLAVLQAKAAIYGAIGGAIFAGLIELAVYLISGVKK